MGVLINNAIGGDMLNYKSEIKKGEEIANLVILVGNTEFSSNCRERLLVQREYSPV